MARPNKQGLDYFPVDVDFYSDIKVRRVKKDCGPASISVLLCLLCNIYRDGYCIWLNEDIPFVIAEITGVTEGAVLEIINKAIQVGFFHEGLKKKYGILTSKGIQRRYSSVVKSSKLKRKDIPLEHDLIESSEHSGKSSEETAKNPEESTQSKVKQSKAKNTPPNPQEGGKTFGLFWESYPKKVGKAETEKVFINLNPDPKLLAAMLSAIDKQKKTKQWKKEDGQFIPNPLKWVTQKRWLDEVVEENGVGRSYDMSELEYDLIHHTPKI